MSAGPAGAGAAVPLILAPPSLHAVLDGRPVGGGLGGAGGETRGEARGDARGEVLGEVALRPLPVADGPRSDPYRLTERLRGLVEEVAEDGHVVDRVLLVVPRQRGAARAVPGPVLRAGDRLVAVGVLPAERPSDLHAWCAARERRAAAAGGADLGASGARGPSHTGEVGDGPVIAAMGTDRFLEPAGRWLASLAAAGLAPVDRRASCTRREELAEVLSAGPDLFLYLGHGHHLGWSGYQGLRWHHLPPQRLPIGTVIVLACSTLAQPAGQRSFGVRLVEEGRACASLGAVRPLPISELVTLGDALVAAIPTAPTIGSLLVELTSAVDAHGPLAGVALDRVVVARVLRSLRVVGDPAASVGARDPTARSCG